MIDTTERARVGHALTYHMRNTGDGQFQAVSTDTAAIICVLEIIAMKLAKIEALLGAANGEKG